MYDLDLAEVGTRHYPGEGWGLTTVATDAGERLLLSDGTPVLRVLHPDSFTEERRFTVTAGGHPVQRINELETVGDQVFANLWQSDEVVVIDPRSGVVRSRFDFSALRQQLDWPGAVPRETDLNGLAWDPERQRLIVTGKNWPRLFVLLIGDCADAAQ